MKLLLLLTTLTFTACSHKQIVPQHASERLPSSETTSSMFSPWEGTEAFAKMYNAIAKAQKEVNVSVYSWSDSGFDKAIEDAVMNGATVRVVLHPSLARGASTQSKVAKLEALKGKGRAMFKVAPKNMHEKFTIVDGVYLVNSSANMSNGAKTKYSENFVFMEGPAHIIQNFQNEFAVIWNSGKDVLSHPQDVVEDRLLYNPKEHQTIGKDITLYSSSMNYNYIENAASTGAFAQGRYIKLDPKGGGKGLYTVRDAIIKGIKNASRSILCSFNHFNQLEVSEALVEAAARGVDVKLTVDNQEFREKWNEKGIEMTPFFVENWKKISGNEGKDAPVRVKFYSHSPNPALWLLNHHKFLLIDNGHADAVLFTGSYNLSETAEHNQFDNMVTYSGPKYASLHKSFLGEFNKLWSLERVGDKPSKEIISYFTTVNAGSLPIHNNRAASMSFEDIIKLRSEVKKIAPSFLRQMNMKTSSCRGYDVAKKVLVGCH